jgi:hypothetical protein
MKVWCCIAFLIILGFICHGVRGNARGVQTLNHPAVAGASGSVSCVH